MVCTLPHIFSLQNKKPAKLSWTGLFNAFRQSFYKGTHNPLKERTQKEWIAGKIYLNVI